MCTCSITAGHFVLKYKSATKLLYTPAMHTQPSAALVKQLETFLQEIGLSAELVASRKLPCYDDCTDLTLADTSQSGREYWLLPAAATAWNEMKLAAAEDRISLIMISAFRSFDYQAQLITKKLVKGQSADKVLATLAPPGCSEHHSGRAIDIGTMGFPPAETSFEESDAFAWLQANAQRFGFTMSFPRDNPYGYIYEPWHWCWNSHTA